MFKTNAKSKLLAAIDAFQRNVASVNGVILDCWKTSSNTTLLKKPGNYNLDKLWMVVCLEADFNMNCKKLGREAMWNGTRCGILSREKYGGKKNSTAAEVVLNQVLTCDRVRSDHRPAVIISNDAKGCFDRIVHSVLNICLRRLGAPNAPIECMITTIQDMKHHIHTAYGLSRRHYKKDRGKPPPQGILQGNGASNAAWSAVATVIVDI